MRIILRVQNVNAQRDWSSEILPFLTCGGGGGHILPSWADYVISGSPCLPEPASNNGLTSSQSLLLPTTTSTDISETIFASSPPSTYFLVQLHSFSHHLQYQMNDAITAASALPPLLHYPSSLLSFRTSARNISNGSTLAINDPHVSTS